MTKDGDIGGLKYLERKPGFLIKENSIKYWVDHLNDFPEWEKYLPDQYIPKIKDAALVHNV